MVTCTKHPVIRLLDINDINGHVRGVRQTQTARIYSRPRLFSQVDLSLQD